MAVCLLSVFNFLTASQAQPSTSIYFWILTRPDYNQTRLGVVCHIHWERIKAIALKHQGLWPSSPHAAGDDISVISLCFSTFKSSVEKGRISAPFLGFEGDASDPNEMDITDCCPFIKRKNLLLVKSQIIVRNL